ncbi:hypothetical protein HMPREF0044_0299 [Gleimia coleocanis DSM 15436]|uniref:Uncharacterized protein n=1 Tax=Gleimia coleocanis DSM 15436 TaxID=525245 RepID=C0VYQ9_9ACTO|nr:PASTA domain-containing protein [Gleimia coleocanis]EEH64562.1 hypothetical protein HMPREF0044_0299 [Gleimia coleocanis DSM 15436]
MKIKTHNWADYLFMIISGSIALSLLGWVYFGNQTTQADQRVVPDVSWMTLIEARETLIEAGFEQFEFTEQGSGRFLGVNEGFSSKIPEKYVIVRQVPAAGKKASRSGANLHLFAYREGSTELEREKVARGKNQK